MHTSHMKKLSLLNCLLFFSLTINAETFGVIGDAGYWNIHSKSVRDSMIKSDVKSLIMPGDNLYNTSLDYIDVWSPWLRKGFKFSVVSLGNHYSSIQEELDFFQMPNNYFYKDIGNVRFIILDSETLTKLDDQRNFLNEALASSDKNFNVVVYHHPMATISYRHGWKEREAFHLKISPVLKKWSAKINLIINGHDHIASLFTYDELPVLVSGAVFETRPAPAFSYQRDSGEFVHTSWVNSEGFYWIRLDFDVESNWIWINFVRTDKEEVSCSILLKDKNIYRKRNCFNNGQIGVLGKPNYQEINSLDN